MSWSKAGHIATVLAVIVAGIALAIQIYNSNHLSKENSLFRWKQAVVFSIISDSSPAGEDFQAIKSKYLKILKQNTDIKKIDSEELQGHTLKSLLINLRALNMVYKSHDGKYKENIIFDFTVDQQNQYLLSIKVQNALQKIVTENSCKFTIKEITNLLSLDTKANLTVINTIINDFVNRGTITINPNNKICLRQDYNQMYEEISHFMSELNEITSNSLKKEFLKIDKNIDKRIKELFQILEADLFDRMKKMDESYKEHIRLTIKKQMENKKITN